MKTTVSKRIAPTGSGSDLTDYHDLGPQERTPRLALVADIEGNELNGMFVLSRLAAFLKSIQAGAQAGLRLRERIVIVPASRTIQINDVRESSGGVKTAKTADNQGQLRLDAVMAITRKAYYRVDIHTANLDVEELPQVRLYAPNDDERASACLFGLPAVIERPHDPGTTSRLVQAWRTCGGENFVIRAGQSGRLQTRHCEILFRALLAFLDRTGTISGLTLAAEEDLRYFGADQVFTISAKQSGLFTSRLEVGQWVQAGEELGHIYDSFSGGVKTRVVAPMAGLLASLRRQPLLYEGNLIARILIPALGHSAVGRRTA